MKNFIKEVVPYIIIVLVVVLIRTYLITPVSVSGSSMLPNYHDKEVLLLSKISYRINSIERFDVVVLDHKDKDGKKEELIKRVIGLPGEHISYKNNKLYVNDKLVEENYTHFDTEDFNLEEVCTCSVIPEGKYLVLGDNRPVSNDSRRLGLIDEKDIKGKIIFRLWPINAIGKTK